jgi:hypothetical protein
MVNLTVREIGLKLSQAGRLKATPLCIYGSETIPESAIPIKDINRCIANAIFNLSVDKSINSVYIGKGVLDGCCPGGQAWFGYKDFLPMLKYFLSTGSEEFRGGAAEYLIANPDLSEKQLNSVGRITPLNNYIVIRKCEAVYEQNFDIKSFLCFGNSEQIRNLCSLAHFRPEDTFTIKMPWGPSCASFVTYPAGMAVNGPRDCIIVGPTDPTGNYWFPQNYLSMGIPFEIAIRMANDLEECFIIKRPEIAYPVKRKHLLKLE